MSISEIFVAVAHVLWNTGNTCTSFGCRISTVY